VFHALKEVHLKKIVEIQLEQIRGRLADRKITLALTDEAKTWLVKLGYDPSYGARPLKRTLQREIENPLARLLLEGKVPDGSAVKVEYDLNRDVLAFRV
jgi:ATP-dependent Clp protease ATP-binding subunit ClpB